MTKEKYGEAKQLLDRIDHIERLLRILKTQDITPPLTRTSAFSLWRYSSNELNLNEGEVEAMIKAFEVELKRLRAEFEKL